MARYGNVSEWTNLNPDEQYVAGHGWQRCSLLMKDDPFCNIFGSEANTRLLNCFFSETMLGVDTLNVNTVEDTERVCALAWEEMPHGDMFSEKFKQRITAIIVQSIFPEEV